MKLINARYAVYHTAEKKGVLAHMRTFATSRGLLVVVNVVVAPPIATMNGKKVGS